MHSEIVQEFDRIRRDFPQRPLVYLPAAQTLLTAADLWDAAVQVSAMLDVAKVNPRGLIAAVLGNRPAYLATFLACRMRNQPLCPLDAGTPPAENTNPHGSYLAPPPPRCRGSWPK